MAEQIKRELVGEQPSQQEPVAWQKRHPLRTEGLWKNTNEHDAKWWRDNAQGWEIRTLYTTPQPAQRKPLTYEEIQTIWRSSEHMNEAEVCRAIEAAHGIKEKS